MLERVRAFRCGVVVLSILLALGGRPAVQCVAWAGMLWDYSREQGLQQGLVDTFGGERPCGLCRALADQDEADPPGSRKGAGEVRYESVAGGGADPCDTLDGAVVVRRAGRARIPAQDEEHAPAPPVPPPRRA